MGKLEENVRKKALGYAKDVSYILFDLSLIVKRIDDGVATQEELAGYMGRLACRHTPGEWKKMWSVFDEWAMLEGEG